MGFIAIRNYLQLPLNELGLRECPRGGKLDLMVGNLTSQPRDRFSPVSRSSEILVFMAIPSNSRARYDLPGNRCGSVMCPSCFSCVTFVAVDVFFMNLVFHRFRHLA